MKAANHDLMLLGRTTWRMILLMKTTLEKLISLCKARTHIAHARGCPSELKVTFVELTIPGQRPDSSSLSPPPSVSLKSILQRFLYAMACSEELYDPLDRLLFPNRSGYCLRLS